MRVKVDWRSASKENYKDFCHRYSSINISFDTWQNILYSYNDQFKEYILETGEKAKLPLGLGEFSINKKKRKRIKVDVRHNREFINLPIDWQKTKAKGKIIYNFNFHTEGFSFNWIWFKSSAMFKQSDLWRFKASRVTSRLLTHYLKSDNKYQHLYREWQH